MTAEDQEGVAPSKPSAGPAGRADDAESSFFQRRPVRRALLLITSYGLMLTLLNDVFFFLAIPGMFGLLIAAFGIALAVMRNPFVASEVPYPVDGTERSAVVKYHRAVVAKRYAVLVLVSVALALVPLVAPVSVLYPLIGVGLALAAAATHCLIDQLRWIQLCSRALQAYTFEFRAPVQTLTLKGGGTRTLRVGGEGSAFPKMSARATVGHEQWPTGIEDGVWFAGDDAFGGMVLAPSTGELMCMQPLDWQAFADERAQASTDRLAKAKQAGMDSSAV